MDMFCFCHFPPSPFAGVAGASSSSAAQATWPPRPKAFVNGWNWWRKRDSYRKRRSSDWMRSLWRRGPGRVEKPLPLMPSWRKRWSRQHSAWSSRASRCSARPSPNVTLITRRLCCTPPHQAILTYRAQLKIESTGSCCIACVDSWILNRPHYFELSPPYKALPYLSTLSPPSEAPWACNGATKPIECT